MEEEAFAELYEQYYPRLVNLVRRSVNEHTDVEGIAQEAFLRAWASYDRFRTGRSFWPWLSVIARRLCIESFRRTDSDARRITTKMTLSYNPVPDPVDLVVDREEQQLLQEAFRALPPRDQRLLALQAIEGWSYDRISEHEGITVEAVRSSLKRARVALRRAYDDARGGLVVVVLRGRRRVRETARSLQGDAGGLVGMLARLGDIAGMAAMAAVVAVAGTTPSPTGAGTTVVAAVLPPVTAVGTPGSPPRPSSTEKSSAPTPPARTVEVASPVMPAVPVESVLATKFARSPDEAIMDQVVTSPDGSTVFASGSCTAPVNCTAMFRSRDRGETWQPLPGAPFGRILLPPAYPADPRIFVASAYQLQMSPDDGRTFGLVAALVESGGAAIGATGPAGAARIVVSSVTGQWDYDERLGTVQPLMRPGLLPMDTMRALRGTSPADETAFFSRPSLPETRLVRCRQATCTATPLAESHNVHVALGPDGVWTWGATLHRSADDGLSFQQIAPPVAGDLWKVIVAADGVYVSVGYSDHGRGGLFRTRDSGRTWQKLGDHDAFRHGVGAFAVLGGGRIIADPGIVQEKGLLCSSDDGGTWSRCNHPAA